VNSFDVSVLGNRSVGECLASSVGSPGQWVLNTERAALCARFRQTHEGIGRTCSVCQNFSNPEKAAACGRRPRVRGGIHQHRMGWY
jgi:hypothetical protein